MQLDPRDGRTLLAAARSGHRGVAMSGGGVHETRDGGQHGSTLVDGLGVVEGFNVSNATCHDPHVVRLCPGNPDRLYRQNHCGVNRLDRQGSRWARIGKRRPRRIGDVGFPLAVHPRDDCAA